MNFIKRSIPNIITSSNLFAGCLAIVFAFKGELLNASILILVAAFLDFFDGLSARLLKVSSLIGKELDSLADVVTFGVGPSVIVYQLLLDFYPSDSIIPYFAFIIAVFSAYRLAKFNVDERQTSSFIGLPTPANALFWLSIPLISWQATNLDSSIANSYLDIILHKNSTLIIAFLLCLLMVNELPLFALKLKSLKWKDNSIQFIFIGISIVLILLFYFVAIPFILILYILLSLINNLIKK